MIFDMSTMDPTAPVVSRPSALQRARVAASALAAAVLGLAPHVLHHVGPLAGAALFAGATGSILFGALGFVAAIPFLVRVRRRHGGWRVPAAILAVMAAVFTLSTTVVGPAITGGDEDDTPPTGEQRPSGAGHDEHH